MICDWWISIRFVCFCISRFISCDGNYDGQLPACRRLLFPLLHAEKGRLRNAVANRVPASGWVPFPRATKEIGDVCTQARWTAAKNTIVKAAFKLRSSPVIEKLSKQNPSGSIFVDRFEFKRANNCVK